MSGRIETFDSRKEQTSKWSQNEAFSVREAGVDIGKSGGQGGSNVSVDQVVTSGREVAGVTVDGERTPILIPNAGEWTQSDWAEADPSDDAYIKNKPTLAQVATSGDYGDLDNTPDLSNFVEDSNYVHTDNNYDAGAKNIVDHVTDNLANKVDKVTGKTLSDNNFTNAQKDKLTNLANIYGVGANLTLDPETNILSANAQPITIDTEMSSSSTNAVQNRVITGALADKVDKVTGKVLSDNNFSNSDKQKLDGIDRGAEVNDISSITVNGTRINPDQDKNVSITVPVNTLYADAPIGSISPFGGANIPDGYFLCNGQAISRTIYSDLFSVIGTSFGPGDGSTTFNVPDLRGEFIRGAGTNSHANQGNGGTVGAHQDATYQPHSMYSSNNSGWLDSDLDGDNNSVRDQDRNVTRTPSGVVSGQTQSITKYQVPGSRGTTGATEIGFYARPTNTSVNFIIKAMHSSMPIDIVDYVDDTIDNALATLEASNIAYDNTDSGLIASNVQDAIDEIAEGSGGGGLLPHLIISAPSGSTVTATKGTTVITAVETNSGVFECDIPEYGDWTISDGTDSNITPVNVVGNLKVSIVNGATIVPTDDVTIWLKCGARYENYTTMTEILADTTCLSGLMSSRNAVDYLLRSTGFMTSICGSDNAMTYIGLNNYCANTLLADLTNWMPSICDSQYFERVLNVKVPVMTDNTTPSGECGGYFGASAYLMFDGDENTACASGEVNAQLDIVTYKFPSIVKIYKYVILPWLYNGVCTLLNVWTECKLDTDANWTRVHSIQLSSGQTAKKHCRFSAPAEYNNFKLIANGWNSNSRRGIKELNFYGRVDV